MRVALLLVALPHHAFTVYVQHDNPGADKEANWPTAPTGRPFHFMVRAYAPAPALTEALKDPATVQRTAGARAGWWGLAVRLVRGRTSTVSRRLFGAEHFTRHVVCSPAATR